MKAIVCNAWGPPENLALGDVDKPVPKDDEVLVRVRASTINTQNVLFTTGKPFFIRLAGRGFFAPALRVPGNDVAGQVEAVGKDVTRFALGDEVFGDASTCGFRAWAEWVCLRPEVLAKKPAGVSFEQAAGAGEAALVALQGLRDQAKIQAGQKVLIYGASGGIGTFAVQIAKAFNAEVTGVCSTRNLELVRALGADHVIDYTQEDYANLATRYDVIFAIPARPIREHLRLLAPNGVYVTTGDPSLRRIYQDMLLGPRLVQNGQRCAGGWTVVPNHKDLQVIAELFAAGKLRTVIDRSFPLAETAQAINHYATGRARGKVIVAVSSSAKHFGNAR